MPQHRLPFVYCRWKIVVRRSWMYLLCTSLSAYSIILSHFCILFFGWAPPTYIWETRPGERHPWMSLLLSHTPNIVRLDFQHYPGTWFWNIISKSIYWYKDSTYCALEAFKYYTDCEWETNIVLWFGSKEIISGICWRKVLGEWL